MVTDEYHGMFLLWVLNLEMLNWGEITSLETKLRTYNLAAVVFQTPRKKHSVNIPDNKVPICPNIWFSHWLLKRGTRQKHTELHIPPGNLEKGRSLVHGRLKKKKKKNRNCLSSNFQNTHFMYFKKLKWLEISLDISFYTDGKIDLFSRFVGNKIPFLIAQKSDGHLPFHGIVTSIHGIYPAATVQIQYTSHELCDHSMIDTKLWMNDA